MSVVQCFVSASKLLLIIRIWQTPGKVIARTDKSRSPALAYLRTSSAANVGTDKDSEKRQRHAIQGFAKRSGFAIVEEFYDAAVSGADPIETRAGFAALLDRIEANGVRIVIVEDAGLRES